MLSEHQIFNNIAVWSYAQGSVDFLNCLLCKVNSLKCFIGVCVCVCVCVCMCVSTYIHLGLKLTNHTESNLLLHSGELGGETMRE